jgi:hypothetical protein
MGYSTVQSIVIKCLGMGLRVTERRFAINDIGRGSMRAARLVETNDAISVFGVDYKRKHGHSGSFLSVKGAPK